MLNIKQMDTKKAIGRDNTPAEAIKEFISVIAPIGQFNWGFRMVVIVQWSYIIIVIDVFL